VSGSEPSVGPEAASEAVLDLHADLYLPTAVEQAIAALAPLASCRLERHGPHLRVHLRALGGGDVTRLRHELANWALSASAVRG